MNRRSFLAMIGLAPLAAYIQIKNGEFPRIPEKRHKDFSEVISEVLRRNAPKIAAAVQEKNALLAALEADNRG